MSLTKSDLFKVFTQAIFLIFGLILLLWFLYRIQEVLLIFFASVVLALVLNAPVAWLVSKGVTRVLATLLTLLGIIIIIVSIVFVVTPPLSREMANLAENLPEYATQLSDRVSEMVSGYPSLEAQLKLDINSLANYAPQIPTLLRRIGRYSLSILGFLGLAVLTLLMAIYMVIHPRPLLNAYLKVFPSRLVEPATRAFIRGSRTVVAWIWANILIGGIEAVSVGIFLSFMRIPGAFLWAVLALFAELVPVLGPYLMAVPPILVTLSVDPTKTPWVLLFYLIMNETMNNFVSPPIRASAMKIHPVTTLFAVLAFGSAFGLLGAVLATPLTGILLSFYDELYVARREPNPDAPRLVKKMMKSSLPEGKDENDDTDGSKPEKLIREGEDRT